MSEDAQEEGKDSRISFSSDDRRHALENRLEEQGRHCIMSVGGRDKDRNEPGQSCMRARDMRWCVAQKGGMINSRYMDVRQERRIGADTVQY